MTKTNATVKDNPPNEPLFQPFQWHDEALDNARLPSSTVMQFVGQVRDITAGVQTILELGEHDAAEDDCEDSQKLLNEYYQANLTRLSIAALGLLSYKSENMTRWAHEYYTQEERAEHSNYNLKTSEENHG